ncbi:MAG: metallophosphoesterase [Bacteroidales bacterium]|nr:metallophosphoesterase [Bacteroidales bacterium]
MKRITTILAIVLSFGLWAQTTQQPLRGGGPYIIYHDDGTVTKVSFDSYFNMFTKHFPHRDSIGLITVWSYEGDYEFSFKLHEKIYTPPARYNSLPERMLIFSDPHGDIVSLVRILKGNKVIDENLNWIFGDGHLMILSDVHGRGNDHTPIFWLLYKLFTEARQAGGYVHFLLGNHEVMVAQHDERFLTPKNLKIAKKMGKRYGDLYNNSTELGRWINSRNTIQIMGNIMFVHAGISPQLIELPLTIEQINDTVRKYIALPRSATENSPHAHLIMRTNGPLWYRGLIDNVHPESTIDKILARYGTTDRPIKKMITGHTRVNEVTSFYNGKIFCMDVTNVRRNNIATGKSVGMMVTPNDLWAVTADGVRVPFLIVEPPCQ